MCERKISIVFRQALTNATTAQTRPCVQEDGRFIPETTTGELAGTLRNFTNVGF